MIYIGQAILPPASMVEIQMQQKLGLLHVQNLIEANAMVTEIKYLPPRLIFKDPKEI